MKAHVYNLNKELFSSWLDYLVTKFGKDVIVERLQNTVTFHFSDGTTINNQQALEVLKAGK